MLCGAGLLLRLLRFLGRVQGYWGESQGRWRGWQGAGGALLFFGSSVHRAELAASGGEVEPQSQFV